MDITVTIPDDQVDRVAAAYNNGPGAFGQTVDATTLSDFLSGQWTDDIRQNVRAYEANQAVRAAQEGLGDVPDPIVPAKTMTEASADRAEALSEARAVEDEAVVVDAKG